MKTYYLLRYYLYDSFERKNKRLLKYPKSRAENVHIMEIIIICNPKFGIRMAWILIKNAFVYVST